MANLKLIKQIADTKSITIAELGAKIGLDAQSVYKIIKTNSTKIETLEKIAGALGVPVSTFFDEKEIKPTESKEIEKRVSALEYRVTNIEASKGK